MTWTAFICLSTRTSEHGNVPLGSIKCRKLFDLLRTTVQYSTSFSGNTSFLGVSEFYPLTPITANVLNARDFFHHWGSNIKKLASRRTHSASLQHRDRGFDPFSGQGCISTWCCDVQEVQPNMQRFIS